MQSWRKDTLEHHSASSTPSTPFVQKPTTHRGFLCRLEAPSLVFHQQSSTQSIARVRHTGTGTKKVWAFRYRCSESQSRSRGCRGEGRQFHSCLATGATVPSLYKAQSEAWLALCWISYARSQWGPPCTRWFVASGQQLVAVQPQAPTWLNHQQNKTVWPVEVFKALLWAVIASMLRRNHGIWYHQERLFWSKFSPEKTRDSPDTHLLPFTAKRGQATARGRPL